MAAVLASMPDLCNRTLAEHVPDSSGRCIACRDELGTQAQWPCLTYTVAKQAQDMHEGAPGAGGSSRHGSAGQRSAPTQRSSSTQHSTSSQHSTLGQQSTFSQHSASNHLVPVPAQKSGRHAR